VEGCEVVLFSDPGCTLNAAVHAVLLEPVHVRLLSGSRGSIQ
jgi:hypothetical protein